jgi:hypothetical protein
MGHAAPALWRPEGGQYEHVAGSRLVGFPGLPDHIAAVRGPQRPRHFDLAEAEEGTGSGQCAPAVRSAYLLGVIGTTGSGIWLMRLISWIHWAGLRIVLISSESFLLFPNSGV